MKPNIKLPIAVGLAIGFAGIAFAQDSTQDTLDTFNYGQTHHGFFYGANNRVNQSADYCQPAETGNRTVEIRPDGMGNFYFYGSSGQQTGAAHTDGMGGYHINYFRGCDY